MLSRLCALLVADKNAGPPQAQTLLQSLELSTSSPEDAQPILAAVLGLVTDRSVDGSTGWDGHLRGLSFAALPVAAWDLVSRRWLTVVE